MLKFYIIYLIPINMIYAVNFSYCFLFNHSLYYYQIQLCFPFMFNSCRILQKQYKHVNLSTKNSNKTEEEEHVEVF